MAECVFCKIIKGEIPSYKAYEDNDTLAFLDIGPVSPGHTLVIPKKHFTNMEEISEEELCNVMKIVKKVGLAIKDGLGVKGYNIALNNDLVAGQAVPHIHFHIMPRQEGDGLKFWPPGKYRDGEAEAVVERIKNNL